MATQGSKPAMKRGRRQEQSVCRHQHREQDVLPLLMPLLAPKCPKTSREGAIPTTNAVRCHSRNSKPGKKMFPNHEAFVDNDYLRGPRGIMQTNHFFKSFKITAHISENQSVISRSLGLYKGGDIRSGSRLPCLANVSSCWDSICSSEWSTPGSHPTFTRFHCKWTENTQKCVSTFSSG